ncbi:MAG: LiaF transmembrane domain-containing protein [Halanaerobiales bacterium]
MKTSFIWGFIIILIGVVLLLNNLGMTDLDVGEIFLTYWPILFIIWGLDTIIEKRKNHNNVNLIFGGVLVVLGAALVSRNLGYLDFNLSIIWSLLWPLFLILIGVNILRSGSLKEKGSTAILSGVEKKRNSWKMTDKSFLALMGGIDLDMTIAEIPQNQTNIELTAIMGGIDIIAPRDVNIVCNNTSILGGMEFFGDDSGGIFMSKKFEHKADIETDKTIYINSQCIMGGIEIK